MSMDCVKVNPADDLLWVFHILDDLFNDNRLTVLETRRLCESLVIGELKDLLE